MRLKSFTNLLYIIFAFFLASAYSCQKDSEVKDSSVIKSVSADSANVSDMVLSPENILASSGMLKITVEDSTYVFDAASDSIAFINVRTDDKTRYYGITAINKAHTLSFGVSSLGVPVSKINTTIAGSQFILSRDIKFAATQYSLSKFTDQQEPGNISLDQFNDHKILAKGSFHAYLSKDDKPESPSYEVTGSFDLQLKK